MACVVASVVLITTVSFCLGASRTSRPGKTELAKGIDKIFAEWNKPDSPGGAVVLTDHGKVVFTGCYGTAVLEHGIPVAPDTRFELASVSKPFTAFAVFLLEKECKLSLKDNIQTYLPELPDYGTPITIADLIHHTSGISDWPRVRAYAGQYGNIGFGISQLLNLVASQRILEFTPGTKWRYSNTNYALLAEIVARVTGEPFGEWMHGNVFGPLGMKNTSFPVSGAEVLPNRASAYSHGSGGKLVRSLVEEFEIPGPAHAFSTVEDMAKWVDNLRTGKVGGRKLVEGMMAKTTLEDGSASSYGGGLGVGEYRGVRTAGHSGQTGAFKSELLYCPDLEVGVVVLGNAGWMPADNLARRVLDVYLADKLEPLPAASAGDAGETDEAASFDLKPAQYQRFLGGYRLEADPSVLVAAAREGDWLVGAMVGEGLDFFKPVGPAEFENRHHTCRLAFVGGEGNDGAPERVLITLDGNEMWATRVEMPPDARWVEECLGFYYSNELEVSYEIIRDPEGLAVRLPNSEKRPLQPADTDILAGGIGILTFLRDGSGHISGFDFGEPEDLGARQIRFARCERLL
jgi:CubicO group peptidase (beta-lactamase class C family)